MLHNLKLHFNYITPEDYEPKVIVLYKDNLENLKYRIFIVDMSTKIYS